MWAYYLELWTTFHPDLSSTSQTDPKVRSFIPSKNEPDGRKRELMADDDQYTKGQFCQWWWPMCGPRGLAKHLICWPISNPSNLWAQPMIPCHPIYIPRHRHRCHRSSMVKYLSSLYSLPKYHRPKTKILHKLLKAF